MSVRIRWGYGWITILQPKMVNDISNVPLLIDEHTSVVATTMYLKPSIVVACSLRHFKMFS
jgi:hypothetical protein